MNDLVLEAIREILRRYSKPGGKSCISREQYISEVPRGDWDLIATSWLFPRTLLDGDLPGAMSDTRGTRGTLGKNNHEPDQKEIGLLVEALRGQQYQGFLRHLIHAYCDPGKECFPVRMPGEGTKCCICGKPVMYWREWRDTCNTNPGLGEENDRNYLAFGSSETSACLCLDCLILLKSFKVFLDNLDPGILNYQKSAPEGLKT